MRTLSKFLYIAILFFTFKKDIFCKTISKSFKKKTKNIELINKKENKGEYKAGKLRSRKYIKNYNKKLKEYKKNITKKFKYIFSKESIFKFLIGLGLSCILLWIGITYYLIIYDFV